ncbi:restriction endonuclease subunit S [Immundisolibacter cernigliae]|uniref:restriction endonuclease subunit S n=1 Tax=Immundisolibacter cernigliae TaxID=1810504 RepID=UPI00096AD96B|nr:restriction endonuclease subunit S [Immundisolibacter cernigliae]
MTDLSRLQEFRLGDACEIAVGRDLVEDRFSVTKTGTHVYPVFSNSVENYGLYGFYDFPEYERKAVTIVGRGAGLGTAFIRDAGFGAIGRLLVLFPNENVDPDYLAEYINDKIEFHVESSGIPQLTGQQCAGYKILLPSIPEQRLIASALTSWNTAIQKTEQLIAAKERHYSHELSRLISRGQHPHAHVGTFAEEVSARNRGGKWRTVSLSDVTTVWKGQQLNKDAMVEDGAYYALNGGIKPSGRTTAWNCETDTITVSEGGNSCGFVSYNRERFWCGGHCYALTKLAKDVDAHYLFHYLKGKQARVMALRVGSGLPNIQKSDLEAFPVVLPDLVTQTAIARYLNALREEIDLLGQSVVALKTQKRGLMQKLLTGQWRLPAQEKAVSA